MKIYSSHSARSILSQKSVKWLTDCLVLKYEDILINGDLELIMSNQLNPTQLLYGEPGEELIHNWLEVINYQAKVREDLTVQPLQGEK